MRFGRNITLLLILTALLIGLLISTRHFNPERRILAGDFIFPIRPETITTLTWDVRDEKGELKTIHLERQGNFWKMDAPYIGMLCDQMEITNFLDSIQSLQVAALLDDNLSKQFTNARQLIVATSERSFACTFGDKPVMGLTQMLARYNHKLIAVKTADIAQLPETIRQLWSRAILPIQVENITSVEWRSTGQPFVSAQKKKNGTWTVTQPFSFEPHAEEVTRVLKMLTGPQTISAYIRPAADEETTQALSETLLANYGLDEESAIRTVIRVKGLSEPIQLRFGNDDPMRSNHVFCLMDDRQAVVSIPKTIRSIFTGAGPFIASHEDLPILGDLANPSSVKIQGKANEDVTILTRNQTLWDISTPTILPADSTLVESLLQSLLSLTGDLTETRPMDKTQLCCSVLLQRADHTTSVPLSFYYGETPDKLFAFREDSGRLYTVERSEFPSLLHDIASLNRTLLNRTLLTIPAENIRRIAVEREGVSTESIICSAGTREWHTEFPRGAYVNTTNVDRWLNIFSNLEAQSVLQGSSAAFGTLRAYGFERPYLKITIDLTAQTNSLRRILLIGHPKDGKIPAMIQGRPLIYEISPEDVQNFEQRLTVMEMPQ